MRREIMIVKFIMWTLILWALLSAGLATWIFLLPRPPEPMGYHGTFDVFELVGSIFYFGLACVALVVLLVTRFIARRSAEPDLGHGFEVRVIDRPE